MKILVLTARGKFPGGFGGSLRRRLDLGPGHRIEVLTVQPPDRPVKVAAVHTVDPSVLPWRPVVPVTGPDAERWTGRRKLVTRTLRGARQALSGVPVPERLQVSRKAKLAIACRTSRDLHRLAATFDVVVALEPGAALGAWWLGQKVPGPLIVYGPKAVRKVLEAQGVELPPPSEVESETDDVPQVQHTVEPRTLPQEPLRLLIAPANYAGQAGAWARAVRAHVPDATAMNLRAGVLANPFPSDYTVAKETFAGDLEWRLQWRRDVMDTFTHVIVEANLPVLGASAGTASDNVLDLRRAGKRVAMLSHGSDARIPSVHAANEEWHPYDALPPAALKTFEQRSRVNAEFYNAFDGPVFVSTLGLIDFIPAAIWLPNIVDIATWHRDEEPMHRSVPIVAHVPSGPQKGSHLIDPILERLAAEGLIEYHRVQGLRFDEMPAVYGAADIVVEQFGIADYSAAACEAMAGGRVVVSRVADAVRQRALDQTGLDLPIAEANPLTLEQVVRGLVADRDGARELAAKGRDYARQVHDGRRTANVLSTWLHGAEG